MDNISLLKQFTGFVSNTGLFTTEHTLIIAVSGGVDSVVLAHLCHQAGYRIEIAHCNFRLRGEMSEADEVFVEALAADLRCPYHVEHFDTALYVKEKKVSVQVAARELRYAWFATLIEKAGGVARARLLTAHHQDDNVETMLMNFFKGTGIAGLRGIRARRDWLVRPLLFASKTDLVDYATTHQLKWRTDQSNNEDKYTRNFFRNQLIPLITKVYPEAEQNMSDNLQRFADIEVLYQEALRTRMKKLAFKKGDEVHVPVRKLLQSTASETLAYELFREFGFTSSAVPAILALCVADTGKYLQSPTHRIIRNRNWLVVAPQVQEQQALVVVDHEGIYATADGELKLTSMKYAGEAVDAGTHTIMADARDLQFPMILRKWKNGDYFYPFGMKKKKKIARFLIDQKLSKTAKEKTWVIECGKKIVWVAGLRMDERLRVTAGTSRIIRFEWNPLNR